MNLDHFGVISLQESKKKCQEIQEEEEEEGGEDLFDQLPDPILIEIFNKILDSKSLYRCLLVSKRFASLVTLVDSINIDINHEKSTKPNGESSILRSGSKSVSKNMIKNLFNKLIIKPVQFMLGRKHSVSDDKARDFVSWICSTMKKFNEVDSMKVLIPCSSSGADIGFRKTMSLLKWEAWYGKELDRCLIIGATSISDRKDKVLDENGENEQVFSDDELKKRIIWIISCLIASSSRHNLMKKVVVDCPKLENVVITDVCKQGKLCMNVNQIKELRDSIINSSNGERLTPPHEAQMGYVGNLVMKLWYVKELEVPSSGKVMKGATMVDIRTENKVENEKEIEDDGYIFKGVFEDDDMFGEVASELLKRKETRMYRLEMNSF